MSRASNRIDGVMYDAWKARFNGSVELEQEEADAAAMGEQGVAVITYKITDVGSKLSKDGVLTRIPVFTATEARVVDDELKQVLVERLGLYSSDADLAPPIKIVPGERTPAQRQVSPTVDEETGEVLGVWDEDAERAAWAARGAELPAEPVVDATGVYDLDRDDQAAIYAGTFPGHHNQSDGVIGHIADMTAGVPRERGATDGPRVQPFRAPGQAEYVPQPRQSAEQLVGEGTKPFGQIKTKDDTLARALETDTGWS